VTLFDCIEFNAGMRWIDVMSDVAFLVMDLRDRRRGDLAARFLNVYLERTGDYAGLDVLRFYVVYRAMVRAKVAAIAKNAADVRGYLALAAHETTPARPTIVITHGVAGSGKSTRAQALVDSGAVAIRSDVERKRLFGAGVYTDASTIATYRRLADLAKTIVLAGYTAVVDATFLKRAQRDLLRGVADDLHVPFVIADCTAPLPVLRERIARRLERGTDASEATADVLMTQLSTEEPLGADELASTR
jgi:predicted kinase